MSPASATRSRLPLRLASVLTCVPAVLLLALVAATSATDTVAGGSAGAAGGTGVPSGTGDAGSPGAAAGAAAAGGTGAAATAPPPVDVHARTDPAIVTIGTRFRFTVEVATAPGAEVVLSQPAEKIGDFDIVDFGDTPPATRGGKTVVTRWYALVGYEPGDHLVKSPPVYFRRPGEDLTEAPADEVLVSIDSVLAKAGNASDVRDIKPPEEPPIDWRPYYVAGASLAAMLALGVLLYRVLNREKRARPAPPPPSPHEVAIEALAWLRRRGLIEIGAFKEYYSMLSGIVRTYLEQRFRVHAPEMTTEEFLLSSARSGRLQSAHRTLLGEFLSESDLVKFARHLPTVADSERAYAAARRFVEETAGDHETDAVAGTSRAAGGGARGSDGVTAAASRAATAGGAAATDASASRGGLATGDNAAARSHGGGRAAR